MQVPNRVGKIYRFDDEVQFTQGFRCLVISPGDVNDCGDMKKVCGWKDCKDKMPWNAMVIAEDKDSIFHVFEVHSFCVSNKWFHEEDICSEDSGDD